MRRASVLSLFTRLPASVLSPKAKLHLFHAIRLIGRVMRSHGFPEIHGRIKLSQCNTVHRESSQLLDGLSSPVAHPFGSAFRSVGEQRLLPSAGRPRQVRITCLAIHPAWIAAALEVVAPRPTLAGELWAKARPRGARRTTARDTSFLRCVLSAQRPRLRPRSAMSASSICDVEISRDGTSASGGEAYFTVAVEWQYRPDSGPSRGDPGRRAIRPQAKFLTWRMLGH